MPDAELDSKARFLLLEVRELLGLSSKSFSSDGEILSGGSVAGFMLGALLGVGSAGVVFEAQDSGGGEFAVKVMLKPEDDETSSLALFKREVGIGRAISHPAVLQTFQAVEHGKARFLVMERVRGMTLRELLDKPISVPLYLRLFRPIAEGLQAAHFEGVVHRDLKPENVMVSVNDEVKILDFGMARWSQDDSLTITNQFKGTIAYCAPEQVTDSRRADHRCDQFAFGMMSFEALTGEQSYPLVSDNPMLNLMNRVNEQPRRLRDVDPQFSEETEAALLKMMAVDPKKRFQDIGLAFAAMAQSLR